MISVAIAAYHGEQYILRQLESIKNQSLQVDEVIICDDCSKDCTVSVVQKFISDNKLTHWHVNVQKVNRGYCLNFYDAICKTNGDIIFLADQDDIWFENKVEEMMKFYDNPEIMAVSCRYNLIDGDDNVIDQNPGIIFVSEKNDGTTEEITAKSQIGCNCVRGCNMSFRKEIKNNISLNKIETLLSHDWMISMTASLSGKNICLNKYLASYRFHDTNASLSSVNAKGIASVKSKRISGLEQSIEAYDFLLKNRKYYPNLTSGLIKDIQRQIYFEQMRLRFVQSKNIFVWMKLGFSLKRFGRYHASVKSGIRIWLGDLAYAYQS